MSEMESLEPKENVPRSNEIHMQTESIILYYPNSYRTRAWSE